MRGIGGRTPTKLAIAFSLALLGCGSESSRRSIDGGTTPRVLPEAGPRDPFWLELPSLGRSGFDEGLTTTANGVGVDDSGSPLLFVGEFVETAPSIQEVVGYVSRVSLPELGTVPLAGPLPTSDDQPLTGALVMATGPGGGPGAVVFSESPLTRERDLFLVEWSADDDSWVSASALLPKPSPRRLLEISDVVYDPTRDRVLLGFDQRQFMPTLDLDAYVYAYSPESGWVDAFGGPLNGLADDGAEVQLDVATDGTVYASIATIVADRTGPLRVARLPPGTDEWEDLGVLGSNVRSHDLGVAPDGVVYVVWEQFGFFVGSPRGNELVVARYDATDERWFAVGEPLQSNPEVLAMRPDIAFGGDDAPVVTWTENRDLPESRSPTTSIFYEGTHPGLARWSPAEAAWLPIPPPVEPGTDRIVRPLPIAALEDGRVVLLASDAPKGAMGPPPVVRGFISRAPIGGGPN